MRKILLIGINILAILLGLALALSYTGNIRRVKIENAKLSFRETMDSMKQVSQAYLNSEQEFADNWASYLAKSGFTVREALDFLSVINTNSSVSAHIIDSETLRGFSTVPNAGTDDHSVNYQKAGKGIRDEFAKLMECGDKSKHLHFTHSYINPIDGKSVVAFCKRVTLKREDGGDRSCILLRVVEAESLRSQWVFPSGYEQTQISLINSEGNYILRSDTMKSDNFYDFLRVYNNLSADDIKAAADEISAKKEGAFEFRDAFGNDAYWVYTTITNHNNYVLVGYTPDSALGDQSTDWTVVLISVCILALLFVVDANYLFYVQKQLKKSADDAKSASDAKTTFLSTMSHDMRTPMNAIIGMTTIAQRHIGDKEQVSECLKKISLASNHLLTLINDILDISKIESGKVTLNPKVFSLAENASDLVNIVRPQVRAKSLSFDVHTVNIKHEYLYADELRINQIFINILSNAVKYTPEGGTVTVTLEQQLRPDSDKARIIYTVKDTGIGMTEEFMKDMFTAFSRAKDGRVDSAQGTGLGLAITKQMIELMNGEIDVVSKPGEGSTFTVTLDLPLADVPSNELNVPPMKILVADDDETFLETAADTLDSLGVHADLASNGEQAVRLAAEAHESGEDYRVIIIDWMMPGMNGAETIKKIRDTTGGNSVFLVVSSYNWSEIESEANGAGADGFLNKPMFRSTTYDKLNELLHFDDRAPVKNTDNFEDMKGLHLLVAEDNDLNWEIIKEMLGFYDITAERAENGEICVETLEAAEKGKFDAVLMDVQMPVMNGQAAAYRIRDSKLDYVKDIPIIAMTADAFAEDVAACLEAKMNGHVAKPIDLKVLMTELRKCVKIDRK